MEPKHNPEQVLALAEERLRSESARRRTMQHVSDLLAANWDVGEVFPQISASIRRVLRQEFASFVLHDPGTGFLVRQAIDFPLGRGLIAAQQVVGTRSPSGRAMEERTTKLYSREQLEDFHEEVAKSFLAEGMQSLCCIPLIRPHGPLGVFIVGSTRKQAFHPDDVELLRQVAAQLALSIENCRAAQEIEQLKRRLGEERSHLQGVKHPEGEFPEIVGDSAALKTVLDQAATVANSDATVLILGETGTGKELVANAIHRLSRRENGPLVKVNCASIPMGLLESELFGHEKGAFTGAVSRKIGRMELADGGTLFLDEVGDIPLELQPKLLRVLQDQEFERLGSNRTVRVSVRLVAATNRNLAQRMTENEFRSDLFYRLNVFPIRMPALRERREDIPLLVRHFVHKSARRMDRYIEIVPKETMATMCEYDWPGNIRELENLIERSVILSPGNVLQVPLTELHSQPGSCAEPESSLEAAEREHIIRVLRECDGVISGANGAAQRLGLKRTTLQSRMQGLGISRGDYLDPPKD